MLKKPIYLIPPIVIAAFVLLLLLDSKASANPSMQQANTPLPTVTGTVSGPMAVVVPGPEPQINLRAGPNTTYDKVGVLLVGQKVPAKGRSPGNEWVMVEYPGVAGGLAWVWSAYVRIDPPVDLPIIEPPPTPTPAVTSTIDPTLAAKFIVTQQATRLPTFTQPPPLAIPTFQADNGAVVGNFPMGFVIIGLAAMGLLFGLISFSQRR
jgi:hypothetical protein